MGWHTNVADLHAPIIHFMRFLLQSLVGRFGCRQSSFPQSTPRERGIRRQAQLFACCWIIVSRMLVHFVSRVAAHGLRCHWEAPLDVHVMGGTPRWGGELTVARGML